MAKIKPDGHIKIKVAMKVDQNLIYMSGPPILPKTKEIIRKLSREQKSGAGSGGGSSAASGVPTGTKHKVTPVFQGDFIAKLCTKLINEKKYKYICWGDFWG